MKMLLILALTLYSFSSFSSGKTRIFCNFTDHSGKQMDIEIEFHPREEVSSILIIDNLKIPVVKSSMVFAYGYYFVEALTKLDNAKVVLFAFPRRVFSDPQDTFRIKIQVDGIDQKSSCKFF